MDKKSLVKAALSAHKKSIIVKQAKKGKDFGKKNVPGKTGFDTVEEKAEQEYGSKKVAQKVASAAFWKKAKTRAS